MLDITIFNLPRGLVALSGYRPRIDIDFTAEGTREPESVSIVSEGARFSSILSTQNQKDLLGVYLRIKQYFCILGIDERKIA